MSPPEGEAEERVTLPTEADGGVGRIDCVDPALPADDTRFFHLPRVGASRVLVVDGDPGDTPTRSEVYFLERALSPWGGRRGDLAVDITTPIGLDALNPEIHRVVFLANVADPRPFGPRLLEFVRKGGQLVISGGDNVTAERYNAALGALLPARLRRPRSVAAAGEEGIPLALPAPDHALIKPFARTGRAGFQAIKSHTLLTFDSYNESEEVSTLLRYEGGLPALVERKMGAGRTWLWTGTFDLGWGNLPLQAMFMPLVHRTVAVLGGATSSSSARFQGLVGTSISVPLPSLTLAPEVYGPDGEVVTSRMEGSSLLFTPTEPGGYAIRLQGAEPIAWVAVNVDPSESDIRHTHSVERVERELDPNLLTQSQSLTKPLLALGLLLFFLQGLFSFRRQT